jgi:hypothetical protein
MKVRDTKRPCFVLILITTLLLVSCAPAAPALPAGQVTGKLLANGEPLGDVTVYIAIAPEGSDSAWVKLNDTTADSEGNFMYENMAPGKYLLMVGKEGAFGGSFEYVIQNGERFIFELPDGEGVDLGEVDATVTRGNQ